MNASTQAHHADDIIYKLIQFTSFIVFTSFFVIGFAEPKYSVKEGLSFDVKQPSNEALATYSIGSLTILGLKGLAKGITNTLGEK